MAVSIRDDREWDLRLGGSTVGPPYGACNVSSIIDNCEKCCRIPALPEVCNALCFREQRVVGAGDVSSRSARIFTL